MINKFNVGDLIVPKRVLVLRKDNEKVDVSEYDSLIITDVHYVTNSSILLEVFFNSKKFKLSLTENSIDRAFKQVNIH